MVYCQECEKDLEIDEGTKALRARSSPCRRVANFEVYRQSVELQKVGEDGWRSEAREDSVKEESEGRRLKHSRHGPK